METYNAPGLVFHEHCRLVIRALRDVIGFRLSFSRNLLVLHLLVLLLWIDVEFHQRDLLCCTYCMHMNK